MEVPVVGWQSGLGVDHTVIVLNKAKAKTNNDFCNFENMSNLQIIMTKLFY
jgi:hypothetical protein